MNVVHTIGSCSVTEHQLERRMRSRATCRDWFHAIMYAAIYIYIYKYSPLSHSQIIPYLCYTRLIESRRLAVSSVTQSNFMRMEINKQHLRCAHHSQCKRKSIPKPRQCNANDHFFPFWFCCCCCEEIKWRIGIGGYFTLPIVEQRRIEQCNWKEIHFWFERKRKMDLLP